MGYYSDEKTIEGDSAGYKTTEKPASSVNLGDLALLQGRPSTVIRRTGPSESGEYKFLGTDYSTNLLHEEATKASTGSETEQVIRVLDLQEWRILDLPDGSATAMDGEKNVKVDVPVLDNNGTLWNRLQTAYDSGKPFVALVMYAPDKKTDLIVNIKYQDSSSIVLDV